ncbi:MAG TPA: YgiT-type zinc finger protein [Saprospiraceae bacterium]|nr:YgiT-type zinc finger protein [Saprospiraceae bacterium]
MEAVKQPLTNLQLSVPRHAKTNGVFRKMLLLESGKSIVIIKDVPAHICESCGERYLYFDADITRKVMQLAEEAVQKGAELQYCVW